MQNLAKVINTYRELFILAGSNARKGQVIYDLPYSSQYYNTEGFLCLFYKSLNRYFLTGNEVHLIQSHRYYNSLENDGWVITYGYLRNLVFQQTATRIESLVDVWFNKHAINLNYEWLKNSVDRMIAGDLFLFQHYRRLESSKPTEYTAFKRQISSFPENRIVYFTQLQKQEYTAFLNWSVSLQDWTYRKDIGFNNNVFRSTEINVPVIEYDIQSLIYFKLVTLGIEWANRYITESTARNTFIKQNGLILGL